MRLLLNVLLFSTLAACGEDQKAPAAQPAKKPQAASSVVDPYKKGGAQGADATVAGQSGVIDPYANGGGGSASASANGGGGSGGANAGGSAGGGVWKALLLSGDYSISAFDNARKKIAALLTAGGIDAANVRQLSMSPSEQTLGVEQTDRAHIKSALAALSLGPNDRCLLHLTSHGSRDGFYLADQATLAADELDQLLTEACGDRPTVVLVSACYSGQFVDSPAMQKPNRAILSAARADRTSFGCGTENEYTYWDSCLIDELPKAKTFNALHDAVKTCIEGKESGGGFTPSEPQAFFGDKAKDLPIF